MERQTDVSDLIPKGLGVYWLLFFIGVASIGVLEFAYLKMSSWTEALGVESIAPIDLTGRSCLLNWGVSTLVLLTAGVSLVNFRLGRRYGDPPRRVHVWFWSAVILLFFSMDVQVALRETFRDLLVAATGTTLYQDGTVWWLILYGFFLAVIGTRLFLEMRFYPPSLGMFLLAVASVGGGTLIDIGIVPVPLDATQVVMLHSGCKASGIVFLFLAFTLFARRQVFRDPDVALRWFARVWNQTSIIRKESSLPPAAPTKEPTELKPAFLSSGQPKSAEPISSPSENKSQKQAVASPGTQSSIGRPVVQKPADVVPFRSVEKTSKESDDFELTGIA